jgi:hypothetical protein
MANKPTENKKAAYERPSIRTESLTAVAAVCNGTTTGGRKATAPTCNASRLKS